MKSNLLKLCFALTICLLSLNINAYSIYDLNYGTEISHHDARTAALGGAGVAGGFNLFDSNLNPANLHYLKQKCGTQLSYSLIKNSENRALPLWNFFDSYIDESTYARNENYYNEVSVGFFYSLPINQNKLSFALVLRPVVNFSADYQEEVRNDEGSDSDNYPPIIAKNFIESEGLLDSYNLLINWGQEFDIINFSLGAEISYLKGTHEHETRIHWTDLAHERVGSGVLQDSIYQSTNKTDGMSFKIGVSSQLNRRLRIASSYSPKIKLKSEIKENEITLNNNDDFILPSKFRLGFLFQPRNPFRTNFHFDLEVINYSEINKFFDDGYAFYVGMEHYVGRAVPFRLGFRHQTAKQDKSITLPTISAGTGFLVLNNLHIDVAGEYGRREFIDKDLFRDGYYAHSALWRQIRPADRGWENPDKVSESFFKLFTSITYNW